MAGILDIFDNPAVLSRLFGGGEGMGGTGGVGATPWSAPTPPQPPPQQQAQAQPEPQEAPRTDPAQTLDFGNMRGGGIGSDAARVPNQPGNMPQTAGGIGSDAARTPDIPQPEWTPPVPPQQVRIPPGAAPTAAPIPPQVRVPPPAVPMPPAGDFVNAPAGQGTGGGLMGALGIDRRNLRSALQGIGKGFTAASKPGLSVGQALAAGAGASMEGGSAAEERQENTLFQQSSVAFRDMLAAKGQKDTEGYRGAQIEYLRARAAAINAGGGPGGAKGSNAWQNTPFGRVTVVEQRALAFDTPRRRSIDKRVAAGMSKEEADGLYADLDKQTEQYRQNLYKASGIDPKQAEKLKTMGEKPDNPFDTKGMTLPQFNAQVPMGAWYKDQNGVVRQRTKPPAGAEAPAMPTQQTTAATQNDDDIAMSGEAA